MTTIRSRRHIGLSAVGLLLAVAAPAFALLDVLPLPKQSQSGVRFAVTEEADEALLFELTLDEKVLGFPVGAVYVGSYRKAADGKIATVSSAYTVTTRSEGKVHAHFRLDRKLAADTRIGLDTTSPLGFGGLQIAFRLSDYVMLGVPGEVSREHLLPYTLPNVVDEPVPAKLRVRPIPREPRKEGLD